MGHFEFVGRGGTVTRAVLRKVGRLIGKLRHLRVYDRRKLYQWQEAATLSRVPRSGENSYVSILGRIEDSMLKV